MRHVVRLGQLGIFVVRHSLYHHGRMSSFGSNARLYEVCVGRLLRGRLVEVLLDIRHVGQEHDACAIGQCLHRMKHHREHHAELRCMPVGNVVPLHDLAVLLHDIRTATSTFFMGIVAAAAHPYIIGGGIHAELYRFGLLHVSIVIGVYLPSSQKVKQC